MPKLLSLLCVLLVFLNGSFQPATATQPHAPSIARPDHLLSSAVVGAPVAAGHFIFWKENHDDHVSIAGYDLATGTTFVVAGQADVAAAIVSDGAIVAWTAWRPATRSLAFQGYDLGTRARFTIAVMPDAEPNSEIALDQGVLYYSASTLTHRGLFARELATGRELLISPSGQRPVAADGVLLWSEEQPSSAGRLSSWTLHMRTRDGRHPDTVLAHGAASYAGFSGYAVSGDAVVWAFSAAGEAGVQLYRINTGTRVAITASGSNPLISAGVVVWTVEASGAPGQVDRWSVEAYDLAAGQRSTVVEASSAAVAARALAADRTIALTVARDFTGRTAELHVSGLQNRELHYDAAPLAPAVQSSACGPANPGACGQVHSGGAALADDSGRWTMQGVQFFLPQFGINGKTFWDINYASALADGSLSYWLDRARGYLRANMLRVFVDLPGTSDGVVVTPTSFETLHSFATEANARGMRLGLVLHNSADWAMTPERAGWISGLLDYFAARGSLPMLAYVSADNEINNHCDNAGKDCFDADEGFDARAYVDGAVGWTAQFRALVKSRAPQLLVTVGISSEMIDADQTRAAFDFFRPDSQGGTLAGLSDFLAPHNYSAGAAGIISDLRFNRAYSGTVVLEEFGFPTDPRQRDPNWTEGPPPCWVNPIQTACSATAPFFVETNLQAQRSGGYAGGSAWMLADMHEKDSASACSDPNKSFALWTGLFAIGGTYCDGGTANRAVGQAKATALRICIAYAGSFVACAEGFPFVARRYLPFVRIR